jgi:hypothetical protein
MFIEAQIKYRVFMEGIFSIAPPELKLCGSWTQPCASLALGLGWANIFCFFEAAV